MRICYLLTALLFLGKLYSLEIHLTYYHPKSQQIVILASLSEKEILENPTLSVDDECFKSYPNYQRAYLTSSNMTHYSTKKCQKCSSGPYLKEFYFPIENYPQLCLPVQLSLDNMGHQTVDLLIPMINSSPLVSLQGQFIYSPNAPFNTIPFLTTKKELYSIILNSLEQKKELEKHIGQHARIEGYETSLHTGKNTTYWAFLLENSSL